MKILQDPQVEHLLPHKNGKYKERKFDWDNLFWSCGHCNGVKNTGMRVYKSELRFEKLLKEMNLLYGVLDEWKKQPKSKVTSRKLKALLRKESKFAELKRCYVREHSADYEGILDYIA